MKATGIIRKIDELGRIVLPKEMRTYMNIQCNESFEILINNNDIILRKHDTTCVLCGSQEDLKECGEKNICTGCIKKINEIE